MVNGLSFCRKQNTRRHACIDDFVIVRRIGRTVECFGKFHSSKFKFTRAANIHPMCFHALPAKIDSKFIWCYDKCTARFRDGYRIAHMIIMTMCQQNQRQASHFQRSRSVSLFPLIKGSIKKCIITSFYFYNRMSMI